MNCTKNISSLLIIRASKMVQCDWLGLLMYSYKLTHKLVVAPFLLHNCKFIFLNNVKEMLKNMHGLVFEVFPVRW